jgi:putative FmdB family regulatory protein
MTYEYACSACGHAWEAEQSISAKPLTECPSCHQASAKRQVSGGAGFILKGGGWYADLYSSSGGNKADSTEKKPGATDKAAGDAKPKTESTPATTTSSDTSSASTTPAKGSSSTGAASS